MLIFLNVINPTNLTNLSDLSSEFRETSNTAVLGIIATHLQSMNKGYVFTTSVLPSVHGGGGGKKLKNAQNVMGSQKCINFFHTILHLTRWG